MSLKDIVNITITRETKAVSRAGFGTPMILGAHKRFTGLIKFYSSPESMLLASGGDFESSDKEYLAAVEAFSQSPTVVQVAVGRRETADNVVLTVSNILDNTEYSVTINGTEFTFTSDADATNLEIAAGLVAAINGGAEPVTASDNADGTFDIDPDVAGVAYSLSADSNITIGSLSTTQTIAEDLSAIKESDNSWYGLAITSRTLSDQLAAADWTEANKKILGLASATSDIINTTDSADTTTLPAQLKASAYARTFSIYHPDAATAYPEMAIFGKILPLDPGEYTTMFKTLASIAVTELTDTQSKNARDKNCNVYEEIGSVNIVREGKVAEGDYIDIIIFVDWLEARIQENIYSRFVNLPKVPFTDAGIAIVEAEIRKVLLDGIAVGGLVDTPEFTVTVPLAANVSANDKANRVLPDVEFEATLAGAIHAVTISGRVVL